MLPRSTARTLTAAALALASTGCATTTHDAWTDTVPPNLRTEASPAPEVGPGSEPASSPEPLAVVSRGRARTQDGPGAGQSTFFVLIGGREMDDDVAWDQIDEPIMIGFEGTRLYDDVLGLEYGLQLARDDTTVLGVDVDNTFLELYGGGRLTGSLGDDGRFHPYLGAGLTFIFADVTGSSGGLSVSDDDSGVGLYVHGGAYYRVGTNFNVGLDARLVSGTDLTIFNIDTDADYTQLAITLGWNI